MTKTAAPMTSGSIWKQMTFFAMPIFLGNLFQQLYNTVDSSDRWKFPGEQCTGRSQLLRKSDLYADWIFEWNLSGSGGNRCPVFWCRR